MKINWKERFKNKTFVVSFAVLVIGFIYQALGMFGVVPCISENAVVNLVVMAIDILVSFGVIVDPTTEGMNDSARALTYGTENDVRKLEE